LKAERAIIREEKKAQAEIKKEEKRIAREALAE
jgi:hypothetical protein